MVNAAHSGDGVLGPTVGTYKERPPLAALQKHVMCAWWHRLPRDFDQPAVIVPDGLVDLQWIDGLLRIAGPDTRPQPESLPRGCTVVGLRFQPAAARLWVGAEISELRDARVPMEAFRGARARQLADWAAEAGSPEGIACRLEAGLAADALRMEVPDEWARYVFHRLAAGITDAAGLSGELGRSPRTLRRMCQSVFGYGPKTLERILRFQRFMQRVRSTGADRDEALAAYAVTAGYADQSHLTREVRRLAGLTPARLRTELSRAAG